jgi:hypothetical protein
MYWVMNLIGDLHGFEGLVDGNIPSPQNPRKAKNEVPSPTLKMISNLGILQKENALKYKESI